MEFASDEALALPLKSGGELTRDTENNIRQPQQPQQHQATSATSAEVEECKCIGTAVSTVVELPPPLTMAQVSRDGGEDVFGFIRNMGRVSICTCWGEEKTGLEEEVC